MVSYRMMVAVSVPSTTARSFTCFSLLSACIQAQTQDISVNLLSKLFHVLSLQQGICSVEAKYDAS